MIRTANAGDRDAWIRLAEQVGALFGAPGMAQDASFLSHADKTLTSGEALVAIDEAGGTCLGLISFSTGRNHINWFAVDARHRGHGVGSSLLKSALDCLDRTREIDVVTFAEQDDAGVAALGVYRKLGFAVVDPVVRDHLGNLRCRMALAPSHAGASGMDEQ